MTQLTSTAYQASNPTQTYFCSNTSSSASTAGADGTTLCTFNGLSQGLCKSSEFSTSGMVMTYGAATTTSSGLTVTEAVCTTPDYYTNSGSGVERGVCVKMCGEAGKMCE